LSSLPLFFIAHKSCLFQNCLNVWISILFAACSICPECGKSFPRLTSLNQHKSKQPCDLTKNKWTKQVIRILIVKQMCFFFFCDVQLHTMEKDHSGVASKDVRRASRLVQTLNDTGKLIFDDRRFKPTSSLLKLFLSSSLILFSSKKMYSSVCLCV
jgi:hypothetical protein